MFENALFCHTKPLLGLRMLIFAEDLKARKQGLEVDADISGQHDCRPAEVKMSPAWEKLASVRKSCSAKKTLVAIQPGRVLKHGFYSIRTQYTRAGRADRLACMWAGLGWAGKLYGLANWHGCKWSVEWWGL